MIPRRPGWLGEEPRGRWLKRGKPIVYREGYTFIVRGNLAMNDLSHAMLKGYSLLCYGSLTVGRGLNRNAIRLLALLREAPAPVHGIYRVTEAGRAWTTVN